MHLPAPQLKLPHHDEPSNPPAEYLPSDQERNDWEAMDPEDRPKNYLPRKYGALSSAVAIAICLLCSLTPHTDPRV